MEYIAKSPFSNFTVSFCLSLLGEWMGKMLTVLELSKLFKSLRYEYHANIVRKPYPPFDGHKYIDIRGNKELKGKVDLTGV